MSGLGDRMKGYEKVFNYRLPDRMPVIIRLDGKNFHTLTRSAEKPFDKRIIIMMDDIATELARQIQGVKFVYTQSDEISLFIHPWSKQTSQAWFDNELQKIISVSAGIASAHASRFAEEAQFYYGNIVFDSRAFILPMHEVINYFIWRQQDWERNSLNMYCSHYYSHRELHNKTESERHEMLYARSLNWNNLSTHLKRGTAILYDRESERWNVVRDMPIISRDREWFWRSTGLHVDRTIIQDQYE
jgi:tRNA(His) 5'-end guanylyltransferase